MRFQPVVDRRQSYLTSPHYPHGYIVETLACGHEHIERIDDHDSGPLRLPSGEVAPRQHRHNARRRRCVECETQARKERRL